MRGLKDKRIVVANDISPSDSASIDRSAALAIVTDSGSKTSHAVIVARSMKVPAVVGVRDLTKRIKNGDWVIVDGYDGVVILNPSESTLFRYGKIREEKESFESRLIQANHEPAITRDGVAVTLMANIERVDEVHTAKEYRAEGVGLYRTEYLFLSSSRVPSEQEQFVAYKTVAEGMAPQPVIIRTLDLGGDKPMAGNPDLFPKENNPFMGFRAIRFCLENRDIFKDQLRAILMASAYGKVRLMFPMISGHEELARANAVLDECKAELRERGQHFDESMAVGAMIEIPSAAATIDLLAPGSGFFSIGTNDLIQYALAVDRMNEKIAHLYEPTHPAIIKLIKATVDAGRRHKVSVSVCGEMAGEPIMTALLIGLGVDELSAAPPLVPQIKYMVRRLKLSEAQALAEFALNSESGAEIFAKCQELAWQSAPSLFESKS